jgi:hypothetical protein
VVVIVDKGAVLSQAFSMSDWGNPRLHIQVKDVERQMQFCLVLAENLGVHS